MEPNAVETLVMRARCATCRDAVVADSPPHTGRCSLGASPSPSFWATTPLRELSPALDNTSPGRAPSGEPLAVADRIDRATAHAKEWVLIGGPPCQAYSLVGRARRTHDQTFAEDKKHFLYREYLGHP